jgi:hypothetical protein
MKQSGYIVAHRNSSTVVSFSEMEIHTRLTFLPDNVSMFTVIWHWARRKINTPDVSDSAYNRVNVLPQTQNGVGDRNMARAPQKTAPSRVVAAASSAVIRAASKGGYRSSLNALKAQKVQDAFTAARRGNGPFGLKK